MAFFRTCPGCGSNLDPGERCDCEQREEQRKKTVTEELKISASGQLYFGFTAKEAKATS